MLPAKYRNSILYLGDEGIRFLAALEMMHRLDRKLPVIMIKVNADPDRSNRIGSMNAIRHLNLNWRVILMTGVPDEDIDVLKNHALGIIYPDLYTISFQYPLSDMEQEVHVHHMTDIDSIEKSIRVMLSARQDI